MNNSTHNDANSRLQIEAANDNPGGAIRVEMTLSAFVTVIAKAYVAQTQKKDHTA
ncbi:hypothetical protein [Pseudooceanicola sp. LIPI14-2-Ac024]|uniref:hypothetical protein n=1 Tax=Pseudooceanicola sp. LIPI14-2-Ac024 TaxID=3344875 RepID=UPI0035CF2456